MAIISTLTVVALAVAGTISGNTIEKEPYDFYDPFGYTEYNILNDTNTYSYNENVENIISSGKYMNRSNVTVLTHGMGGNASHWLVRQNSVEENADNEIFVLSENKDSLPYALCNRDDREGDLGFPLDVINTNVYKFGYDDINCTTVKLWKLELISDDNYEFRRKCSNDEILLDGQLVLLYEGNMGYSNFTISNQLAYEYFRNALNNILSKIAIQQYGYLPSINLIGHSRGGLVNLLYANDYPEIVNNLISLGTPFVGSQWTEVMVDFFKMAYGDENYTAYDELLDTNNINLYASLLNQLPSSVNSYAIGFGQTQNYLINSISSIIIDNTEFEVILRELLNTILDEEISEEDIDTIVNNIINFLLNIFVAQFDSAEFHLYYNSIKLTNYILGKYSDNQIFADLKLLLEDFESVLIRDIFNGSFYSNFNGVTSDVCVNWDSQLGYERCSMTPIYNFTNRDTIVFGDVENNNYFDLDHCADSNLPWVAHNFETKSPTAINLIIDYLNENDGFHEHEYMGFATSETHYLYCICGIYKLEEEYHTFEYQYLDEVTHRHYCSHNECSYFNDLPHNFDYTFVDDDNHDKRCDECYYHVEESHLLNVYIGFNINSHTVYCACGVVGSTSSHTLNVVTGKCSLCGFPIALPQNPVVPPIIIGPII